MTINKQDRDAIADMIASTRAGGFDSGTLPLEDSGTSLGALRKAASIGSVNGRK